MSDSIKDINTKRFSSLKSAFSKKGSLSVKDSAGSESSASTDSDVCAAIIGGSGFYEIPEMVNTEELSISTPYGDVFSLFSGELEGKKIIFQLRHGAGHRLPPHKVNYRANIWALKSLGVNRVLSVNAVGGISKDASPGSLVVPDQIIDYTYGREHTFADLLNEEINHIDFTHPFDFGLRQLLVNELGLLAQDWCSIGVYGCTQGPRLETTAEINRLEKDGCSVVGMTAMPEAALARELNISYASICIVANWAAGRSNDLISLQEIHAHIEKSSITVRKLLQKVVVHF